MKITVEAAAVVDQMASYGVVAEGLRKRFPVGGLFRRRRFVEALRGVTFKAPRGSIYSLLGPNGAGKTTTIRIISTLLAPDEGRAWVSGFDVVEERWEVRKRISVMLSVERGFYWKLTGRENLIYFGTLYGIPSRELGRRVDEVLELVGLKSLGAADRLFEDMSLGMKARLGLARALLKDPEVLLLDEPTLGLDPPSARHIRNLLRELASQGKTIILTTHNMFEADIISDVVGIIVDGRIMVEGTPQELKSLVSKRVPLRITYRALDLAGDDSIADKIMEFLGGEALVSVKDEHVTVRVLTDPGQEEKMVEKAVRLGELLGLKLVESRIEEPSLEDVFIAVTGKGGLRRV